MGIFVWRGDEKQQRNDHWRLQQPCASKTTTDGTFDESVPFMTADDQESDGANSRSKSSASSSMYATFESTLPITGSASVSKRRQSWWSYVLQVCVCLPFRSSPPPEPHQRPPQLDQPQPKQQLKPPLRRLCRILVGAAVCLSLLVYHMLWENRTPVYEAPEQWNWDRNIYMSRRSNDRVPLEQQRAPHRDRIALMAHFGSAGLQHLLEISSRPDRAYAHQWGMDYVQYVAAGSTRDPSVLRRCFDKVWVLHSIIHGLDDVGQQPGVVGTTRGATATATATAAQYRPYPYSAMVFLPPDAVVTNLDYDLLQLLPKDKLVAIAGWHPVIQSKSDIVLFNLDHPKAREVAELWWEMVRPQSVTCGDGNDLDMLVTAITAATGADNEKDLSAYIESLEETPDGFVGNGEVLKYLPPVVPGCRTLMLLNNLKQNEASLQATADSVCYRYYPRCEVLY